MKGAWGTDVKGDESSVSIWGGAGAGGTWPGGLEAKEEVCRVTSERSCRVCEL